MPLRKSLLNELRAIPHETFIRQWIGYATAHRPYRPKSSNAEPYWQTIQRLGEHPTQYDLNAFICTHQNAAVDEPVEHYPERWHCEEFYNAYQKLGWHRAGTHNLNIRYGQMTMALIAQAVTAMLRRRLGSPFERWDAPHLAQDLFCGLEGDVRLNGDTILVTYHNAPNAELLAENYTDLPAKLSARGCRTSRAVALWLQNRFPLQVIVDPDQPER